MDLDFGQPIKRDDIEIEKLFEAEILKLKLISGEKGLNNKIITIELNRPGLALTGFFDYFSDFKIQIFGKTELSYLLQLSEKMMKKRLRDIFAYNLPCVIVTTDLEVPNYLKYLSIKRNIPVLSTPLATTYFSTQLTTFLEKLLAPQLNVHGVLMDVYGVGVLIVGKSGVGKSECALELVERGHRLVADDVVSIIALSNNVLIGQGSDVLKHHMEIRGIGIVNVEALFGAGSVRTSKKISLLVNLEKWAEEKQYERLGFDSTNYKIFDIDIPLVTIPVAPGRNISILIEVAALTERLHESGFNPALEFNRNLIERMLNKKNKSLENNEKD